MSAPTVGLDEAASALADALLEAGAPRPRILGLLGAGLGGLPDLLSEAASLSLGDLDLRLPEAWAGADVLTGRLAGAAVWLLEDPIPSTPPDPVAAPFEAALPVWAAAAAGATLVLHTAGAGALPDSEGGPRAPGDLAVVRDHLNLSGSTPLLGLGETRLGPLFPDLSRLHHAGLRRHAVDLGRELALPVREAVVACAPPVALATPAERHWYATAGADLWAQGIAPAYLAAGHAGLALLSLLAVAETGNGPTDVAGMVRAAGRARESLDRLLAGLAPHLAEAAAALADD